MTGGTVVVDVETAMAGDGGGDFLCLSVLCVVCCVLCVVKEADGR